MEEEVRKSEGFSWGKNLIIVIVAAAILWGVLYLKPSSEIGINQNTYNNSDYGIRVDYPKNWRSEECKDNASLLVALGDREQLVVCSSDAPINAYVLVGVANPTFWDGTVDDQVTALSSILYDVAVTDVNVDGVPAKRINGKIKDFEGEAAQVLPANTLISQVIFIKDNKMYRLFYQDLANTGNMQEFDNILETFELTN